MSRELSSDPAEAFRPEGPRGAWVAGVLAGLLTLALIALFAFGLWQKNRPGRDGSSADGSSADGANRDFEVTLPERIVSLAPSFTTLIQEFGAGDRLVGVSDHCKDVPPDVRRVGSFSIPNLEEIVGLDPDWVLGISSEGQAQLFRSLEERGVRVETLPGNTVADVERMITVIGSKLGVPSVVESHLAEIERRRSRPRSDKPVRVVFVINRDPIWVVGGGGFVDEMMGWAGGVNVFGEEAEPWIPVDLERILARDPAVIVDNSQGAVSTEETLLYWSRFDSLRAVRSGRVVSFPRVYAGVRLPEWVDRLAEILRGASGAPRK